MNFTAAPALFFLLASLALVALHFPRGGEAGTAERFGWAAILTGLVHPLAAWIVAAFGLDGDVTPFFAFDLLGFALLSGAVTGRAPGGNAFFGVAPLAAVTLAISVQQVPLHGPGVTGPLLAFVLLSVTLVAAAADSARHAKLFREATRPLNALALLCGGGALLLLVAVLLLASALASPPTHAALLETAGLLWLLFKLMLAANLLQLFAARRGEMTDRLQRALVQAANNAGTDLRVAAQAFYQLPAKALVADGDGRILFATADARRQLGHPNLADRTLESLFVAVQPAGHQLVRGLLERPDHQAQLMQIRMTPVECQGLPYHLLQLEPQPFDFAGVRQLLVESRSDDAHHASGLLDQNFMIAAMADGWYRLMEPVDRYAGAGVFWDKLRILSASDGEIAHLESAIAGTASATGWLMMRNGGGLSVLLQRLLTPEQKPFYRVELTLVDEALHAGTGAPCPNGNGGWR